MLFLVQRTDEVGYDEYNGFIIRASDENEARQIANKQQVKRSYDDTNYFLDKTASKCIPIHPNGNSEIILGDYNAG